jgi:cellulose synthase/poly-beta-1,6-N-acetylglucosamine synthase-like glycosyltransferase
MTLSIFAQIIFGFSLAVLFYVYFGYPLLVYVISRLYPKQVKCAIFEPTVSLIITAYNEERDLENKLRNTLQIDYPKEKLEIIVASDCSTDRTDDIARKFADQGVKLYRQTERHGKTLAQNMAVEKARGEIILFSDATTIYQPDVLQKMMPNFADESVGCVAGKLVFVDDSNSTVGKGARSYWNYETFLKESESRACSLIGTSGCLYSVRKSVYQPMYAEACSDFLIAILVYKKGLRTIYEPAAVCTEETNKQSKKEMQMRVRVISRTLTDLWRNREMLNPFRSGFFAMQLISHKILRYSVPFFLILMLFTAGVAAFYSTLFFYIFLLQLMFYATAFIGWLLEKNGIKLSILPIPFYFVLANLAAVIGFYKFITGERYTQWETGRGNQMNPSYVDSKTR